LPNVSGHAMRTKKLTIKIITFLVLVTTLISCDQLNSAYLKNNSGQPISTSLYFFNYKPSDTQSAQHKYIKHLLADPAIKDNAKIILLGQGIARVNFTLPDSAVIRLMFDTAPLDKRNIDFDAIKITSEKNKIELFDKGKIFDNFKSETKKNIRFLTIST
jgi:hypothetical protein